LVETLSDEDLRHLAAAIPTDALSPGIADSLRRPTIGGIREACAELIASGRFDAAQGLCEAALERPEFGPWAMTGLARVATNRGDHRAAVAAWQRCLGRFPEQVQPTWLIELSRAERRLGDTVAAEQTLRRCIEEFPKFAPALAALAELLGALARPDEAVIVWQAVMAEFAEEAKPWWFVGLVTSLRNLDRAEAAERAFDELVRRFPDDVAALAWQAGEAGRREDWSRALSLWSAWLERHADAARPEWLSGRALALFRLWRADEALAAWEDVVAGFAEFEPACLQLAGALEELGRWDTAEGVWADLVRRFPHRATPEWLARQARCRLNRRVDQALGPVIAELEGRFPNSSAGRRLAVEFSIRSNLGFSEFASAIEGAARQFPADRELSSRYATLLLASGRLPEAVALVEKLEAGGIDHFALISRWRIVRDREGDAAMKLIDAVPRPYRSREVLELRAWAAVRRDRQESAKKLWRTILSTTYFPGAHAPDPELELITSARHWPKSVGVAAFGTIRDELPNLPEFLRHHRGIGVRRFFFIDHMSADGSGDYLRAQPDVILYRAREDYRRSAAGTRWVNALIGRHGAGGWCLRVDADESFIYPGCETTPLDRLVDYLEHEDAEGVAAFMLDVFPERLFDANGNPASRADCRFYDGDYLWSGRVRAPYLQPAGGIRSRLFRVQEYLHKIPLIKSSRAIHLSVHDATALRLATVTGALLHYNLLALARTRPTRSTGDEGFPISRAPNLQTMDRRQRYAARFRDLAAADLRLTGVSQPLADSLTLTDRGLLRAPPEFRRWLNGSAERSSSVEQLA
jgi:tetratricopeptide (TPR) repeat protein